MLKLKEIVILLECFILFLLLFVFPVLFQTDFSWPSAGAPFPTLHSDWLQGTLKGLFLPVGRGLEKGLRRPSRVSVWPNKCICRSAAVGSWLFSLVRLFFFPHLLGPLMTMVSEGDDGKHVWYVRCKYSGSVKRQRLVFVWETVTEESGFCFLTVKWLKTGVQPKLWVKLSRTTVCDQKRSYESSYLCIELFLINHNYLVPMLFVYI